MRASWCASAIAVVMVALFLGQAVGQDYPIDRGSSIVGGAFAFSSMGGDLYEAQGGRTTVAAASADLSYFVSPGVALGGVFALARTSVGSSTSLSWGIGPQGTLFIGAGSRPQIVGTIYPFFQIGVIYQRGSSDEYYEDQDFSGTTISLGGGFVRMFSRDVGLSVEMTYDIDNMSFESYDGEYSESGNKIGIGIGLVFFRY